MDPVIVVGGGISGVACARTVAEAGYAVRLLDRGRRLGGRMAIRTVQDRAVDTGASYFTVNDDAFAAVVRDWADRGLARPWTDTFDVFDDGVASQPKTGADRWAAPAGLRGLVEDLARGLDVERQTVETVTVGAEGALLVDGRSAAAVALAMPDPQARRLLEHRSAAAAAVLDDPFEPVLALSAGWDEHSWAPDFDGAFVNGDDRLAWIADDGRRRGDGAAVLVAHSTPTLAAAHLDSPGDAERPLLQALMTTMGIEQDPAWAHVHRWTFARPAGRRTASHHLTHDGIGVCGDAWSEKPRVEAAHLSGVALGRAIAERLRG